MDRPLKETVYTPDSELLSFRRKLRKMTGNLAASREFGQAEPLPTVLVSDNGSELSSKALFFRHQKTGAKSSVPVKQSMFSGDLIQPSHTTKPLSTE